MLWGAVAGYIGGVVDSFMMRIVDAMLSIPALFLALVVVSMVTPTRPLLILVIALTSWLTTSRLVRGEALSLRTRDYVQAMKVMGGGNTRAVLRHIAPNAIGTIMVNATFQVADAIALIVALGYLGLRIRPPQQDWGSMLSDGVRYVDDGYWWLIIPAGFCIVIVIAAAILIGRGPARRGRGPACSARRPDHDRTHEDIWHRCYRLRTCTRTSGCAARPCTLWTA